MIDVGLTSIIINVHSHIVRGNSTGQERVRQHNVAVDLLSRDAFTKTSVLLNAVIIL